MRTNSQKKLLFKVEKFNVEKEIEKEKNSFLNKKTKLPENNNNYEGYERPWLNKIDQYVQLRLSDGGKRSFYLNGKISIVGLGGEIIEEIECDKDLISNEKTDKNLK